MMRMRNKNDGLPPNLNGAAVKEWELRPGGMLVQTRTNADQTNNIPPPTIRVRVKYGSIYHQIHISSQATFGELKKMLSEPTGLHHEDQKLFYKDKERASKAFLDTAGVKDKSKLVLQEDPVNHEKRLLEMRKNAKIEKAVKTVSEISLEVDRLAGQVSGLESVISKGGKVDEKYVANLIELLMNQLVTLDGILGEGDIKLQRQMQVKRVQKYVETLDVLKIKNSTPTSNGSHEQRHSKGHVSLSVQHSCDSLIDSPKQQEEQLSRHSASGDNVVITTQWETFEFAAPPNHPAQPSFTWDLL
ncbi:hypothetical protein BUALT_Bualt01G0068400 [Buddleja alternifolia]|uniref:BAG family molecular chaperone regulator 1 n=1 Tax=Buddleja alternifolia TaxID=168488 RepID=A0AAV6YCX0_9LAMI|nr:hypothetical protein BUALT_Bualt01G0068400 [Buddleja alternifolia]